MNILPYHIHSILKIYRDSAGSVPLENDSPATAALPADRVDISEEGRKEQIKREIVADIVRKIR
ncbi:MAG: hypothetical protein R3231_00600 [bacterium]|nr:hypothetical protein [bacterium]